MLRELYIENLAVIEKAIISFNGKLNIFTGETGAGKSILIGGISAILGGRVSRDIVRTGADKSVITALFSEIPENVIQKLEEYGYHAENDELLLQREISIDGRNTARICGRTATVAVLKEVAENLISIHGQHDNQLLLNADKQREILDNYGNLQEKLSIYEECFKSFSAISRKIRRLQSEDELKDTKIQILQEKVNDVKKARLKKGEEAEVASELATIRNAAAIADNLSIISTSIKGYEGRDGACDLVQNAVTAVSKIEDFAPKYEDLKGRLTDALLELKDIGRDIEMCDDLIDRQRLSMLEEKMSEMLKLKRKYGVDIDELIDKSTIWQQELDELTGSGSVIEKFQEDKRILGERVRILAMEISSIREAAAQDLTKKIIEHLVYLDMPNVVIYFNIVQGKFTKTGMDNVDILISVNKGEEPKPLRKVASGGELSRIMLAITSVVADSDNIPAMIFDEIDTGISGRAAQKVGNMMSEIAQKRQVLCVTHLAQIAAMADRHLLIEKSSDETNTFTHIRALDFEGQKAEIARIISGDESNEISLQNAEELISRRQK